MDDTNRALLLEEMDADELGINPPICAGYDLKTAPRYTLRHEVDARSEASGQGQLHTARVISSAGSRPPSLG